MRAETVEGALVGVTAVETRRNTPKPFPPTPSIGEPCWQPAREPEASILQEPTAHGRGVWI